MDIAIKIISVRNVLNNKREGFIYTGVDRDGNKFEFIFSQRLEFGNYCCISIRDFRKVNGIVKVIDFTLYPLDIKNRRLYLYEHPFNSDKFKIN